MDFYNPPYWCPVCGEELDISLKHPGNGGQSQNCIAKFECGYCGFSSNLQIGKSVGEAIYNLLEGKDYLKVRN